MDEEIRKKLYELNRKLIEIRNSDVKIPIDVYHALCDLGKELVSLEIKK